jgi:hypothetical protein
VRYNPPSPSAKFKIWLEAERGFLQAPMKTASDGIASLGQYIWVPDGSGNNSNPGYGGYAEYVFDVPVAGQYVLWGRVLSNNGSNDSLFVSMDEASYMLWTTQITTTWTWDRANNWAVADPVYFNLAQGTHTLLIEQREDGTKLDRLLLTNDLTYVPQGTGDIERTKIWQEAERGFLQAPMKTASDSGASSGQYIWVADGSGNNSNPGYGGYAEYVFNVPVAGQYVLWSRVLSNSGSNDSFFVSMDDGSYVLWATQISTIWTWDRVNNGVVDPVYFNLAADIHTLLVDQREDGTKLDRLLLTNDMNYVPQGVGDPGGTKIWLEGEGGTLKAPMRTASDSGASSGQYIWVPEGSGSNSNPGYGGYAEYSFDVPVAGQYVLWGRVLSNSGSNDSFFVSLDNSGYLIWDTLISGSWVWDRAINRDVADPAYFNLTAGTHTLRIEQREDGAKVDRLLLTNDLSYVP